VHDYFIDQHGGVIKDYMYHTLLHMHKMIMRPFWYNATLHRWLYISMQVLPRVVVAAVLLVEAVIHHKFDYSYKILVLLLIPLLWKIVIYCLEKHLILQKLFTTIFFEIHVIRDPEEAQIKCPGETVPIYELIDREVSSEVLSHYPFISSDADRDELRQNYVAFVEVESGFFKILSSTGPVPQLSREYNYAMILLHLLLLLLWCYMFLKTIATIWL
jgi:hypothetical protein